MKHLPFDSIYREDFQVLEERQGNVRLFPHTAQLPAIHRALNLEFLGPLPGKLSRLDHRANDFDRIVRKDLALIFAGGFNAMRKDEVRLMPLPDPNRIMQVAVVQRIQKDTPSGRCHRFRFFAGQAFCPEILLNGKRLVFSEHALERFSNRVPHTLGADITDFLFTFFGTPLISLPLASGRAFFCQAMPSFLAFPYKESEKEFFITTCLSIDQIHTFETEMPPPPYNFHYGTEFVRPTLRHWVPSWKMKEMQTSWERKVPLRKFEFNDRFDWKRIAQLGPDFARQQGYGPDSKFVFMDNIVGPNMLSLGSGDAAPTHDELAGYKEWKPDVDWDAIFAERLAPPERYDEIKS